jgi:uncharacterized Zn ribbon protein
MKSFKRFLNEETMPYATNTRGIIDIDNSSVRDGLNSQIAGVMSGKFITPYIALERVTKALANYHIFIPRHSFLEGDSGMFVWPINQFGIKFGQQNDGTFVQDGEVLKDTSKGIHPEGEDFKTTQEPNKEVNKPFSIFFEYRQSDCGMFNVFCEVVSQEELDEILADLESEMNDDGEDEDLNEETIDEACWEGYRKDGMKKMFGKMYPNCVKVDEEKFTNRVPSANPYGNLDAAKKEMSKPKPVPTRNTNDLDNRNRDAEDNTIVEGDKLNKIKKIKAQLAQAQAAQMGEKKKNLRLRDVRAKMRGNVNDFDPRQLKTMKEEKTDAARKTLANRVKKEWLKSDVGKIKK